MQPLYVHDSQRYPSDPTSMTVWLRLAAAQAHGIHCEAFSARKLRLLLPELAALSPLAPEAFLPRLVQTCASAGVAVVVVPAVAKCRASSAAAMLSPRKAMVALSLRYQRDDHFWFSFFAAVAALCAERPAAAHARDLLIPPEAAASLPGLTTEAQVRTFAQRLGIAPGIIAGRMQHDGLIPWSAMNTLKRPVDLSWAIHGHDAATSTWQTVSEAAKLLLADISGLDLAKARARVSIASRRGQFLSNGQAKYEHRVEPTSYAAWRLAQRERDLNAAWEDESPEPLTTARP